MSVKETIELLNALEVLGMTVAKVTKDGKINISDLPVVLELLNKFATIIEGIKGVKEIPEELKDLSNEELIQLGTKVYAIIKSIVETIKK